MFPTFISILDIQSWWEVPSIAHFCSLFRTAFNLLDFDIEDLEEALLTDGTEESSWLQDLIVRLLSGCIPSNEISTFNYQMFLRRLFRQKCQEHDQFNPFNTDIDFQLLPLRTKVDILHALCDFRLDADDVLDQLKNLEADSLRVEPLGYDSNDSAYWYFYGTRLYREDYTTKNNKKKAVWQVICFTEDDWFQLTKKLKKSANKAERQLHLTLSENFLPELPRLFKEKENLARKRLLDNLPRRASSRLKKLETENEKDFQTKERLIEKNAKEPSLSPEEEAKQKKKDLENRRNEAYERRAKLKEQNEDETVEEDSNDEMASTGSKRHKNKEKTIVKDKAAKSSKSSKKRDRHSDSETNPSLSKPTTTTTTVGRQTNNSLSAATGQILIETVKTTSKKKLKTSQVFRQTDEDLQTGMHKILDFVKNHEDAWPFTDPVEEEYAPNYYSIVRKPMDLQRMEERLDSGYYKSFDKFRMDFQLIVDNCKLYNGAENEYTEMVDNLLQVFEKGTNKYLDQISSSDDEIAVVTVTEDNTKPKSKPPESTANSRRKPMLVAQTDRKRERSESEESLNSTRSNSYDSPPREVVTRSTKHRHADTKPSKSKKKSKIEMKEKAEIKKEKKSKSKKASKKEKKKKVKSKNVSRSPSLSPPQSDSPPPSSPDSTLDFFPKETPKRKSQEELSDSEIVTKEDKRHSQSSEHFEEDSDLDKKPKKDPISVSPKPKDKHNKLRETIEKLKAKSEIKLEFELDHPKENKSKKTETKKPQIETELDTTETNTFNKQSSNMDALSIATEQTLKDINKWLDDTPKFTEFSSASNSPTYPVLDELDPIANKLPEKKPPKKEPNKDPKKKPFRDPSKFFKRREVQRTIDRLQPGKSKGNLITNVQNTNETFPLLKLKDTKNSLIVKTNTNAPKLSLGSVLDSFGKHKFVGEEKKPSKEVEEKIAVKETTQEVIVEEKKDNPPQEVVPEDPTTGGATPNLSAWFKAFGAPKIPPVAKKEEKKATPLPSPDLNQPVPRQRRISTGSSMSERSSFSQDMDSPRVGMDERGAYPAPYPSPMHKSPSGASPVMASPRPDISPKATYSTINGQIRVGFYQDTVSNKSSPDKSSSPKENIQSPYPHYPSEHVYTPNTTENAYYTYTYTNYSSTNPTPPYTTEGNYAYYDNAKSVEYSPHSPTILPQDPKSDKPVKKRAYELPQITNQRYEIDPRLTQQIELKKTLDGKEKGYVHQNIPDPKNLAVQQEEFFGKPINTFGYQDANYVGMAGQNKIDLESSYAMNIVGRDRSAAAAQNKIDLESSYAMNIVGRDRNVAAAQNKAGPESNYASNIPGRDASQSKIGAESNYPLNILGRDRTQNKIDTESNYPPNIPGRDASQSKIGAESNYPLNILARERTQNKPDLESNYVLGRDGNGATSQNKIDVELSYPLSILGKDRTQSKIDTESNYAPNISGSKIDAELNYAPNISGRDGTQNKIGLESNYALNIPTQNKIDAESNYAPNISESKIDADLNYAPNISGRDRTQNKIDQESNYAKQAQNKPDPGPNYPLNIPGRDRTAPPSDQDSNYPLNIPGRDKTATSSHNQESSYPLSIPGRDRNAAQSQAKIDLSKYTNMGYTGPDLNTRTPEKDMSHVRYGNPNLALQQMGYKAAETTTSQHASSNNQTYSSADVARTMVNLFGNDERMMAGLQNTGSFYDKTHISSAAQALPIFSQANMAAIQSYNQSIQATSTSLYNRQMSDIQSQSMMASDLKSSQQVALQEKKAKKRKSSKNVPGSSSDTQQQTPTNQGFQSYAGLKGNSSLEPSAISLKTSSVVPGSAFNFGPTPAGLGLYADKDGYPNFLDEFRAAPNYYMAAAAAAHHRSTPEAADKQTTRPAHQNPSPQSYPFLGAPQGRSTYPFMPNAQAQLMDTSSPLYQHYLQAGVLNQGLLPPPGAYPPGYHPALSMRQPYDSMNRPPWL